jgi:hypothetical protein
MVNRELTAVRAVYLIIAWVIASQPAQAWEVRSSCTSSRLYGTSSCRLVGSEGPPPRDYAQEAAEDKVRQQRIKEWESFCKPASIQDKYGVVRLVYAHENCDLGRSR